MNDYNVYPIINHHDYLLMLVVMINGEIDINLGKFLTTSLFSLTGIIVFIRKIIPKWPNHSGSWIIIIYPE